MYLVIDGTETLDTGSRRQALRACRELSRQHRRPLEVQSASGHEVFQYKGGSLTRYRFMTPGERVRARRPRD